MRRQKQRILSLFPAALMLCLTAVPAAAESAESATAATMQLMKTH